MPPAALAFTVRKALGYADGSVADLDPIKSKMRQDWDRRAREDAGYYVAFGRRSQTREEFFATAADVLRTLKEEFRRWPPGTDLSQLRALEIGCGPGRILLPLSQIFGHVSGVDVSGEMVALARENLRDVSNATALAGDGASLAGIGSESVDFCYSYAVFQHIPDRRVILNYLREARRVLRPGGILKCQVNGLPQGTAVGHRPPPIAGWSSRAAVAASRHDPGDTYLPDTWSGVSFCPEEIAGFAAAEGLQLLAMDGFDSQYLWLTAGKPETAAVPPGKFLAVRIVQVTNTFTADAVVPRDGRFSSASIWVLGLSPGEDLNSLRVEIDGVPTAPNFTGKHVWKGPAQVNVYLPPGVRTGVVPVRLLSRGEVISNTAPMRVIDAGPLAPRVVSVTDGVNLLSTFSIESRCVKVQIEEVDVSSVTELRQILSAKIDTGPITEIEMFRVDPLPRRYELNLVVPASVPAGPHNIMIRLGARQLPPIGIELGG